MKQFARYGFAVLLLAGSAAAESKVKMENLPPAVQKTVKEQTQRAKLIGLSKEKEGGQTVYELETTVNGRSRDLMIDSAGTILSVEDEVALDSVPEPARKAIQQKAGAGKIIKVETVTKGSEVSYEAAYTSKSGKKAEYGVNADGTPHK
jgi:CRISPR/Cas system CSM-associated protein Csm3 (group 7 of RAMP superfamily)